MRSDENQASVAKELANAYKKIKLYEYEINKIEESQVEMGSIHKYFILNPGSSRWKPSSRRKRP